MFCKFCNKKLPRRGIKHDVHNHCKDAYISKLKKELKKELAELEHERDMKLISERIRRAAGVEPQIEIVIKPWPQVPKIFDKMFNISIIDDYVNPINNPLMLNIYSKTFIDSFNSFNSFNSKINNIDSIDNIAFNTLPQGLEGTQTETKRSDSWHDNHAEQCQQTTGKPNTRDKQ